MNVRVVCECGESVVIKYIWVMNGSMVEVELKVRV